MVLLSPPSSGASPAQGPRRCVPNLPGSLVRSLSRRLAMDATTAMRVALLYGDMEWQAGGEQEVFYSARDYSRRTGLSRNTVLADLQRLLQLGAVQILRSTENGNNYALQGLMPFHPQPGAEAEDPWLRERATPGSPVEPPPGSPVEPPPGSGHEPPPGLDAEPPGSPVEPPCPRFSTDPGSAGEPPPGSRHEPPLAQPLSHPWLTTSATLEKSLKIQEKQEGRKAEGQQQQPPLTPDVHQEPIQGQEHPGASEGAVASPPGEASEPEPPQGRELLSVERLAPSRSPGLSHAPSRANPASPSRPWSHQKPQAEPEVAAAQASTGRTAGPSSARTAGHQPGTASHRPTTTSQGPATAEPALSAKETTAGPETSAALLERLLEAYRASKPAEWPSPSALTLTPGRKGKLQAALRHAGGTDALVRRVEAALAHVPPWYRATYPVRPDGSRRPAHQFFDVLFRATGDEREGGLEAWHVFSWSEAGSREPLAPTGDRSGPSGGRRGGGLTATGAPAETPPETDLERARRLFIWDTPTWRLRAIEAFELPMSERRRLLGLLEALGEGCPGAAAFQFPDPTDPPPADPATGPREPPKPARTALNEHLPPFAL